MVTEITHELEMVAQLATTAKNKDTSRENCPENRKASGNRFSNDSRNAASNLKTRWPSRNRNEHVSQMATGLDGQTELIKLNIQINDKGVTEAIIDTGSSISMIDTDFVKQQSLAVDDFEIKVRSVDGRTLLSVGLVTTEIGIVTDQDNPLQKLTMTFAIMTLGNGRGNIILGNDFLRKSNAVIDVAKQAITFFGNPRPHRSGKKRKAETEIEEGEDFRWPVIRLVTDDPPKDNLIYVQINVNDSEETAVIDTGADKCIMSSATADKLGVKPDTSKCPTILAIDGQEIGIAGTAELTIQYDLDNTPKTITLEVIVSIDDRDFFILGNNFATATSAVIHSRDRKVVFPNFGKLQKKPDPEEKLNRKPRQKLPKVKFTTKQEFDHLLQDYDATREQQSTSGQRTKFMFLKGPPEKWTIEDFNNEFLVGEKNVETDELRFGEGTITIGKFMTSEQKAKLHSLLQKYRTVFSFPDEPLGKCSLYLHQIDTGDSLPVHTQPYATSDKARQEIRDHVEKNLKDGVIRPSKSPWASSPHLVGKADGTSRMVVDYRALNKVTKRDSYPMPSIDLALSCLNGSKFFSTLDLLQGFFQIMMSPESIEKTAFTTHDGLFEFTRLPFGLRNSPSTFQRIMDVILSDIKYSQVMVFLDDLLVFSETFEQHLERLENVLQRLRDAGLTVKPSKVFLMLPGVKYLGHFIDDTGVKMQFEKLEAIIKFPRPNSVTDIKSFLGLAGYYRRFIRNFAALSEPLSRLTRKELKFEWTDLQQAAFNFLKRELLSYPVLCHYNSKLPIELHVDACGTGLGAVIGHRNGKEFHPIQYISRLLSDTTRKDTRQRIKKHFV